MSEKAYTYVGVVEVNGEAVYVYRDATHLYTGFVTNAGFAAVDEFEIDEDLSIDENLQKVVECL